MENNIDSINFKSEEVQEILSKPPRNISFWGNIIYTLVAIILLSALYVIKRESYIDSEILIVKTNPVDNIESLYDGTIISLDVQSNQIVDKNVNIIKLRYGKNDTIIKSGISGKVSFGNLLFEGKKIKKGEELMRLIPQKNEIVKGEILLSDKELKIKEGNTIDFAFENFPEISNVCGIMKNVSPFPNKDGKYYVEIYFSLKEKNKINRVLINSGEAFYKIKIKSS